MWKKCALLGALYELLTACEIGWEVNFIEHVYNPANKNKITTSNCL